jgi:predicted lipoprotein with Yx(FWY)xxD motif
MHRSTRAAAVAGAVSAALLVTAAGCGDSGSSKAAPASTSTTATPAKAAPKPKPKPAGKKVTLHSSDYGTILADGRGRALYLFTHDTNKSRCYGQCATAWPPLLTKGEPKAVGKVKQDLLGTVKRTDGRRQVTYNGHPLYYYVSDTRPGQVGCQAVLEYGGYWYVVDRAGKAIR